MAEQDYIQLNAELQQVITPEQAWHFLIIPQEVNGNRVSFYIDKDAHSEALKDELEMLLDKDVTLKQANGEVIRKTLGRYYRKTNGKNKQHSGSIIDFKSEDFIEKIISEANAIGSSDIHMEIYEDNCRIRLRIDGKLVERYVLKKEQYPPVVNKIKIKSNLDIAEKRLPQDGRIIFISGNDKFDIRVSVLPTLHGEKIVMRLLSKDTTHIDINALGFNDDQLSYYLEGVKRTNGIILISGPTGSGKTTTLYATLKILNKEETNILTIEDPIEYTLKGINQVQLKESIGLSFARALRTFLRQDPDIIMLGEIRDAETAQMAIRAALTGHLVLSTIHTNSAWGTVTRLIDMGIPSFLLASTLNLSVAQRLLRLLCPHCKEEQSFEPSFYPRNFTPPEKITTHYIAKGCESCFYTGYKGRKAVYEVIPIDHDFIEQIRQEQFDVRNLLKERNIEQLSESAFTLFKQGETTIEEIYSILMNN